MSVKPPTTTDLVLLVLRASPLFSFTMREIVERIAERGHVVTINAVASALANLESGAVNVDRSRRPMQYSARNARRPVH